MSTLPLDNAPEWHVPIKVDEITDKVKIIELKPTDEELVTLARRVDVFKINALQAKIRAQRNSGNMVIHITGELFAKIEQKCVITLAPVYSDIVENFESWYADTQETISFAKAKRERLSDKEKLEQPILDEFDDPEPITNGIIDLGELVTQYLSLGIDPYPKTEEMKKRELKDDSELTVLRDHLDNPFAALKDWRAKENKEDF